MENIDYFLIENSHKFFSFSSKHVPKIRTLSLQISEPSYTCIKSLYQIITISYHCLIML